MSFTLAELAERIGASLHGEKSIEIRDLKPLESAGPGELSFFSPKKQGLHSELYDLARSTTAAALIVPAHDPAIPVPQLVVPHPLSAVTALSQMFAKPVALADGIHPLAAVSASARIGANVSIGAFSVIGEDVEIGPDTIIHPQVVIYDRVQIGMKCIVHAGVIIREDVRLGDDCVIQNGAILGGDGFGYFPDKILGHRRIPHIGTVVLEDRVDIGANSTIDRAMLGETKIGKATKIDNLVMVGHNTHIGERSLLCGQAGVSGSCEIGNDVVLGGNVGVADHLKIADGVRAAAKTGITGSISTRIDVAGYPHTPVREWRRQIAALRKLPERFRESRAGRVDSLSGLEADAKPGQSPAAKSN